MYEKLADYYRHEEEVLITRIEYEPFEHFLKGEDISVGELPVIKLYRKGRNRVFIYMGEFEMEKIKNWLEERMAESDPPNKEL